MRGWFTYVLDIGMDIADRAKTDAEFEEVWNHFGVVARYLTTHRPGGVGDAEKEANGTLDAARADADRLARQLAATHSAVHCGEQCSDLMHTEVVYALRQHEEATR